MYVKYCVALKLYKWKDSCLISLKCIFLNSLEGCNVMNWQGVVISLCTLISLLTFAVYPSCASAISQYADHYQRDFKCLHFRDKDCCRCHPKNNLVFAHQKTTNNEMQRKKFMGDLTFLHVRAYGSHSDWET